MARFDVFKFASPAVPLVMDVQANLLCDLQTRVVIPLIPLAKAQQEILPRLKPVLDIHQKPYVFMVTDIGTVKTSDLGKFITNLEDQRYDIMNAIDFLFQGF